MLTFTLKLNPVVAFVSENRASRRLGEVVHVEDGGVPVDKKVKTKRASEGRGKESVPFLLHRLRNDSYVSAERSRLPTDDVTKRERSFPT